MGDWGGEGPFLPLSNEDARGEALKNDGVNLATMNL